MKNLLSIIFVATLCTTTHAQKCKFDYEKRDAFTGKTSFAIFCDLTKFWTMSVAGTDDNVYGLNLGLLFNGVKKDEIHKGDTLMLALENSAPIILISNAEFLPNPIASGGSVYTRYQPSYTISKKQLEILSQHKALAFRVYFGALWNGDDIKPKNAEKISNAAACVISKN